MANVAKPYKEGKTWSLRRRVFGQDLYEPGHATGAAAKKEMDKLVLGLEQRGKPKGFGPRKTTLGQALQDMGMERLGFMKGAKQEAMAGVNYPGRPATTILAGRGGGKFLMFRVVLAGVLFGSFSAAVWQAKRVRP